VKAGLKFPAGSKSLDISSARGCAKKNHSLPLKLWLSDTLQEYMLIFKAKCETHLCHDITVNLTPGFFYNF